MENSKKIPFKNYIILAFIIIFSIILILYFYMLYSAYEKEKYNTSVVTEYLDIIHYNELDEYLVENKDAVIYFTAFNDRKVYNFEKRFKRFIDKNSLSGNILYLNVTKELNNKKVCKEFNDKYCTDVPCIIIFENGNVKSIYSIKNNNYNISLLKNYLIDEGVIDA